MAHAAQLGQAWCGCWQSALKIQGCRCWPVQIGPFPTVALSVPFGISNKCDCLPLSNGAVQVSAQWCLTGAGQRLPFAGGCGFVFPIRITNLVDGAQVPVFGQGRQVRDWLYVDDHCRAIKLLVDRGVNGEVYHVGAGQECENIELTRKLLTIMGKDERSIKFVHGRPGHDMRYSLDSSNLQKLGWSPKIGLDAGLKNTVDWYLGHEDWWRPLKKNLDPRYSKGFWGAKKWSMKGSPIKTGSQFILNNVI